MSRKKKSINSSAMIVTAVAIILIIIIGISSNQRENITSIEKWIGNVFTPIQNTFNKVITGVGENVVTIFNISNIKEENEFLQNKILELEKEIIEESITQAELQELKNLSYALNYIDSVHSYNLVSGNIIGKNSGNWFNVFTINIGESHGVKKDSIVLNGNGLVGKIYEVGGNWSKVVSIIDNNSSVSFQLMRDSSLQGVITGSITNEISGYLFDPLADVIVGDKIITSGLGIYPSGIEIGEIIEVGKTGDHLLKTIKVQPSVNFQRITKVVVIDSQDYDY